MFVVLPYKPLGNAAKVHSFQWVAHLQSVFFGSSLLLESDLIKLGAHPAKQEVLPEW